MHLILDGHAKNTELMIDKAVMRHWLAEAVKKAGMTPFGDPYVWGFPWPGSDDWSALTGFQPLMESHCSIHCWPERKYAFVDLFSCKDFDSDKVTEFIIRTLQMTNTKIIILDRGLSGNGGIIPAELRSVNGY